MSLINNAKLYQQNHFLGLIGAIADDLLLVNLEGRESLSASFVYELRTLTNKNERDLLEYHGKAISLRLGNGHDGLPQRYFHGVVTRIRYQQHVDEDAECFLTLEPSLALLSMGQEMRIWQSMSVPDVVRQLLNEHGIDQVDVQLQGNYPPREYCLQYRESVLDFIQRVLAEEGIYYFFRHSESGHTLVLADHPTSHKPIQNETLSWFQYGEPMSEATIDNWISSVSLLPAAVKLQGVNMIQAASIDAQQAANSSDAQADKVSFSDITPGGERSQITLEAQKIMAAGEANRQCFESSVKAHWLSCGETFSLTDHPTDNRAYCIHSLILKASNNVGDSSSHFDCQLRALNNNLPWQPPYPARPVIHGLLTATVVGPASEQIHTDEYGRIKIQFPWDKINPHDDTSSCWVRVAQSWTGGQFGAQFIPRVGSEVLVNFLQGHPDYPLVTGTVYNGQNMPPFALPGEKNETGFMTRSTPDGSVDEGHRLSFNDKKGEEKLTIIAQKDFSVTVKNDMDSVIKANRNTELTKGSDQLTLKEGDLHVTLNKGNLNQDVTGNVSTKVDSGDYALSVAGGSGSVKTDKALTLESTQSLVLKVGSNEINLSASGITLKGMMISIEGSGTAELKGAMTTVTGSGMTQISGGVITIG